MKTPWEDFPHIWNNSTSFFNYLRGCLRKAWSTNPVKLELLKEKRKQINNPNPKGKKPMVWGFDCEMCKKTFIISEGQVDHIIPAGKLSKVEDIQGFVERLLFVGKKDLRLVCKGCNSALALSDKQGITFEEAAIQKEIIKICREKKDKEFLIEKGITPANNLLSRKKQIKEVLFDGVV